VSKAPTITKIPVLPISYADAQPLLAALGGSVVPERWRGGLPITYRFGPGPAKVHLRVKSDWSLKTLHDVIARLPGTGEAETPTGTAAATSTWAARTRSRRSRTA
jgi:N-acetylated-alpha-linked acidic dipeptidase